MTVVEQLLSAILDEDVEIDDALAAVVAAGEQETAVSQIGTTLLSQNNPTFVRMRAILALNQLKRPSAIAFLGESLANDPDPGVRRIALGSLEQQDDIHAIPYFQQAMADTEDDLRQSAMLSLAVAVRKLVIARQAGNAQESIEVLRQITAVNLNALLRQPMTAQDIGNVSMQQAAATAFGLIGSTESVTYLCQYLNELQNEETGGEETDIQFLGKLKVLRTIVTALGDIGAVNAIPCLIATLQDSEDLSVKRLAVSALGRMGHDTCIPVLVDRFLRDSSDDVREISRDSLAKTYPDWRKKAAQFVQKLRDGTEQRSQVDVNGVITAVSPPADEGQPYQLTDYFISQAVDHIEEDRLVALMADLIITSANGSKTVAGERITIFGEAMNITEQQLQPLRVEIGGKALDPVLEKLQENLVQYFQQPIATLNVETQSVWRNTVRFANMGFMLRSGMSVALFLFGMYLMHDSYQLFKANPDSTTALFGAGIPFLTGLGTMLSMVFWGPLREIRHAVSDVGAANVAFIAYIHRVLQVSHTFSNYYLNGKISFEELEKSGKLIEDTMDDAVRVLRDLKDGKEVSSGGLSSDPQSLIPDPQNNE